MRHLFAAAALAASTLLVPAGTDVAEAAHVAPGRTAVSAEVASACKYRRTGNVWRCVTPGAYCPRAAHGRYGYAKSTGKRYRCVRYSSGKWRWKRA